MKVFFKTGSVICDVGFFTLCALLLSGCDVLNRFTGDEVSTVLVRSLAKNSSNNMATIVLSQSHNSPTALKLSSDGFSLIVPISLSPEVAIQVCTSTVALPIHHGDVSIDNLDCFASGTGMAMAATPPNLGMPLVITEGDGHNYYSIERRISDKEVTTVVINRVEPAIPKQLVYMHILIDANQDGLSSPKERWYATATWE